MRVFLLWNEDSNVIKVCLSKESAISHIKKLNETDRIAEHRFNDSKMRDGRFLYDLELEAGDSRYRLEEMDAE